MTAVEGMTRELKSILIQSMARHSDYEFIWKIDPKAVDADLLTNASNVHPMKWVDQRSILGG